MGPDRQGPNAATRAFGAVALTGSLIAIVLLAAAALDGTSQPVPIVATGAGSPSATSTAEPKRTEVDDRSDDSRAERTADGNPIVWVRDDRRVDLHDSPSGKRVDTTGDETEFGSPSVFSVVRREESWLGVTTPEVPNGELGWIKADPDKLRGGYVDHEIEVDLSDRRASLLRDGEVAMRWPVTIGGPDSETPTGRFAVTDTFRGGLNPAYGCCALALSATQPDLPADWPGGDRIAIHGTGGPLGGAVSYGCIRSADPVVDRLVDRVPLGTPVVIKP